MSEIDDLRAQVEHLTRKCVQWKLCSHGNPAEDSVPSYLITYIAHEPNENGSYNVFTAIGKYCPPWPNDTEPRAHWMVLDDQAIDEDNYSEWEPPFLYNCAVIAWAEMPKPYTGELKDTP